MWSAIIRLGGIGSERMELSPCALPLGSCLFNLCPCSVNVVFYQMPLAPYTPPHAGSSRRKVTHLSLFKAISSIFIRASEPCCSLFEALFSPSSLAILAFISARSISHELRSRSCRCHSVCRNRITPRSDHAPQISPRVTETLGQRDLPCKVYSVPRG